MPDDPSPGPLAGLVVCDLSTVLAGPYCTMLLADLGADVVKVEPPGGDPTRLYGPPYVAGESGYYLSINRNKRGVRLDLKQDAGREALRRLIARSDVLVENQRPGGLDRLGFPDDELARINPRLVHLSITGYGPNGPDADKPGFDFIIQAISGLMSITGQPDASGGEPTKVGVAIADLTTAMLGAIAVLAALRERDGGSEAIRGSGRGQRIDLSLLGSTVSWLINQAANYLVGGMVPGRMGNFHPNITPYETFATADGQIAVAVGSERQWVRFCEATGGAELATDPRFATNGERVTNRGALRTQLAARFGARSSEEWLAALEAAEVPCGLVRDLAQVFADPQLEALGMVETVAHPSIGDIRLTGIPFKLSQTPGTIRRHPPLLGEHTDEVLGELGFDAAEVQAMHDTDAV
ncbi:MAG: CoA transferase [Candidatus Limnocylindrales bacterium]